MAIQADTLAYAQSMATLRLEAERARYADVRPWVRGYYDCPELLLGPLVVDVDAQVLARVIFPKAYFLWAQRYVREAVVRKPAANASAEARVFWMLDVWGVMVQGLLALNVMDKTLGYHPVYGSLNVGNLLEPPSAVAAPFQAAYAELSKRLLDKKRKMTPASRLAAKDWTAAAIAPPPFMDLPFSWAAVSRDVQQRLFRLMPWTLGGMDSLKVPGDTPLDYAWSRAVEQYRVLRIQQGIKAPKFTGRIRVSVKDWSYAEMYEKWWPLHMGKRTQMPELHQYITDVAHEGTQADLEWHVLLYPNFAWSYSNIGVLLDAFTGLNYEVVLADQVARWITKTAPRNNQPKPGKYIPAPLTCDDWTDLKANRRKAIKARAQAAAVAPVVGVTGTVAGAKQAIKEIRDGLATAEAALAAASLAVPALAAAAGIAGPAIATAMASLATVTATAQAAGPIVGGMVAASALLAMALIEIGGVAEMYPADPEGVPTFYVQPNPFLRTIKQRGYGTIASQGATGEAFVRTLDAIKNIELATRIDMGFYAGEWQPPKPLRVLASPVKAKFTPKKSAPAPAAPKPMSPLEVCQHLFGAWAQSDPKRSACLRAEDIAQVYALCQHHLTGKLPQAELLKQFDALVNAACARLQRRPPSVFQAFLVGFSRSGNPFVREG